LLQGMWICCIEFNFCKEPTSSHVQVFLRLAFSLLLCPGWGCGLSPLPYCYTPCSMVEYIVSFININFNVCEFQLICICCLLLPFLDLSQLLPLHESQCDDFVSDSWMCRKVLGVSNPPS
jgi:hypothetical protein